jgi:hypothetical protein
VFRAPGQENVPRDQQNKPTKNIHRGLRQKKGKSSPPSPMPAPEAWRWTATKTLVEEGFTSRVGSRTLDLFRFTTGRVGSPSNTAGPNTRVLCSLEGGGWQCELRGGLYSPVAVAGRHWDISWDGRRPGEGMCKGRGKHTTKPVWGYT